MYINRRVSLAVALIAATLPIAIGQAAPAESPPSKRARPPRPSPAFELDPLRILKIFSSVGPGSNPGQTGPNVILALDTSLRMGYDYQGNYYDLRVWDKHLDPPAAQGLGVPAGARYYRRRFDGLRRTLAGGAHYEGTRLEAIDDTMGDYATFFDPSRLGMVRDGLAQAVEENQAIVRVGLLRSRHGNGATLPDAGNESPVHVAPAVRPGDLGFSGAWKVSLALTSTHNVNANATGEEVIVRADSAGSSAAVLSRLRLAPDESGGLLPAGADADSFVDAPVTRLLEDTRAEVIRVMKADSSRSQPCRNTVVVLVLGGTEGGSLDPVAVARDFASVTAGGVSKPVPIYVIAVGPAVADVAQLRQIASVSGGRYFEATDANQVAYAANYAVQSAYRRSEDFDTRRLSEFQTVSPIVGTVDLTGAKDVTGASLPATAIKTPAGGAIPQRNNVLLTGGFTLPGFAASLRAFRVYRPEADSSRPSGYKFVNDGTRLWVASTPAASTRNVFTYVPGAGMVEFDETRASLLRTYLRVPSDEDAASLIGFVRAQPLGAIIDSTPAIMDPPSIEPAPDAAYGSRDKPGTFAGDRAHRRAIVFYGGNDGMIHGIDARLGVEVWAFVPFNLLSKLRTLRDGQPVDKFEYFSDSSPKLVDVKVNSVWRTYMIVGQGPGGTFYQTFDVSDAGLSVSSESDHVSAVLDAFASPSIIPLSWTFPRYEAFDYTIASEVTPYGDLGATATAIEKTVGHTWSDPAVGQALDSTGPYIMMVGSGYLSPSQENQGARARGRAGTSFYVIEMATGAVLDAHDVSDDPSKNNLKNALHGGPTALGLSDARFIDQAYIGDTEGNVWRFNLNRGSNSTITLNPPVKIYDAFKENPIYASLALVHVGGSNRYIFLSTGSTSLPGVNKLQHFKLIGVLDPGGNGQGQKRFETVLEGSAHRKGDERPSSALAVAGDVVFFTTTTEFPGDPCVEPESALRALTYLGGPAYDTNGDHRVDQKDSAIITQTRGRATAVSVFDRHLFFGAGSNLESFGDPQDFNNGVGPAGVRILSWREVR